MKPVTDIITLYDIKLLVDTFYTKVQHDTLLAPIFNNRIKDNWDEHLEKMYRFWQTVLLDEHTYFGSPFHPHASMHLEQSHFSIWIKLFTETVDELFTGHKAVEAKWRAEKMAEMFQIKLEHLRKSSATNIF
ncbi:MAG: group III truncated hemoglobin [Daejeonella sp.]